MSGEFNKILSILTVVGLGAFAVLNATNVIALSNGLVSAAGTYTSGIAHLGATA